ncbi:MAG: Gfo/Idh/MocA family oxidoreductase [Planctomycetes bacterium]|nr:Gfo/Idh/MocA family oxidoreductase [Planctomycetota bacterium]
MAVSQELRIAIVGTGFIADVHMQVLRTLPRVRVAAVCDTLPGRAERFARRHGIARAFTELAGMLATDGIDVVHVAVPPAAHVAVARACLQAGCHVFVEKPLALQEPELVELQAIAATTGRRLGVNHNQTFHPALLRLKDHIAAGRLGRLEHVALQHNVPLRQLQTGDTGHFMFATEANILHEQGVHVFSMVHDLLGSAREVAAQTAPPRVLGNGNRFFDTWNVLLRCERGTADVRMAFGRSGLETTIHAIGSDGVAFVDLQRGACWLRRKTRWLDFLDHGRNLAAGGLHLLRRAAASVFGYATALFKLSFPEDPFLRGMRGSIAGFLGAVRAGGAVPCPPTAARAVLDMCLRTANAVGARSTPTLGADWPTPGPPRAREVVVLGGGGMIGRRCVERLLRQQRPVTLLVRRPALLPAAWRDAGLRVFGGDATDQAALQRAFAGADAVLHLATVAGDEAGAVERTMAAALRAAGEAARAASVRRLVWTSSTAALYLGGSAPLTGASGPDPQPAARGPYARGKIAAERQLDDLRAQGLDAVVLRPAIVLAAGAPLEHSGLGLWVRDNHCVGWGAGRTPLPLVLADDVADACVAALDAPAARGKTYNLAGGVRPTAREFVREMRVRTGRDYCFHPTPLWWMWLQELGKHLVKMLARRPRELPSLRDLRSRSFRAPLDCSDAGRDLGFQPEADRARFLQRLFDSATERR